MRSFKPLERQIQGFQFKLQQAIAIRDEEIDRLAETLVLYKSKIVELQNQIQMIDHEMEVVKERKDSNVKCDKAEIEAKIALKKRQHHQIKQRIQEEQAHEIDVLQDQFAQQLESLQGEASPAYIEQLQNIEKSKANTIKMLEQFNNAIQEMDDSNESEISLSAEEIERRDKRIQDLQEIVRLRNEERLESLRESKTKLEECMEMIENMNDEHERAVVNMKTKISEMDNRYVAEVSRMKEDHKALIMVQKAKLEKANNQYQRLRKALKTLKAGHQSQLKQSINEMNNVRSAFSQSAPASCGIENADPQRMKDIEKNKLKLLNSKTIIRQKEESLNRVRQENQRLKQEIGKIRHQLEYSYRIPLNS